MRRKGQSTLEYVIILTTIIAAILFAATQFIKPRVEDSLKSVTGEMLKQVRKIEF